MTRWRWSRSTPRSCVIDIYYYILLLLLCIFLNYIFDQVALEPLNPSELPKMLDGLRKVCVWVCVKEKEKGEGERAREGEGEGESGGGSDGRKGDDSLSEMAETRAEII